jgi:hypothetical protein
MSKRILYAGLMVGALSLCATLLPRTSSGRRASETVTVDKDNIGGVVTSSKGPEAGVWVVAETTDLPTKYAKIVVTDDQGRYLLPELPAANYQVFVRGYGLIDSPRVKAKPGQQLDLTAVIAPDGKTAAQYYPASYWLSLAKIPEGRIPVNDVAGRIKICLDCHQIGDKATREVTTVTQKFGPFKTTLDAWDRRTASGPMGASMNAQFLGLGDQRTMFADWTDRIAKGAYPEAPPRPAGIERNVVLTLWDWGKPSDYMHDEAASDLRNPSINADGPVYGVVSQGNDDMVWLDPRTNTAYSAKVPSQAEATITMNMPSPYWGNQNIWLSSSKPRSSAIDSLGRVWYSARNRGTATDGGNQPAFCKAGSSNKFAKYFPMPDSMKQVGMYDPEKKSFSEIDTCFTTDHNEFGPDGSLFFGQPGYIGWVDTAAWDRTHDPEASQGWLPAVLDTNGDGKITKPWTEPGEPIDPKKDHRIDFGCYAISVSPVDGSAWCSGTGLNRNELVRIVRGSNPPYTSYAEVYAPPKGQDPPIFSSGGVSVDSEGVAWQNWRGSDHITSFDRRKCKVLRGPTATGQHCPEGWTIYRKAGPTFQGIAINTNLTYLIFADRHGILGLGKDVPMTGAVNSDAILALVPKTGEFVTIRIPYPMGYFARSMQGRIDNAKAGWKGRAFWTSYNPYTAWHLEGGQGTKDKVVKVQMRPDPLAR